MFKPHFLTLSLTDKTDLQRGDKSIALPSLSIYCSYLYLKMT